MNYRERLERVIPGGSHTYSRGSDQFPSNAPQILERGKGAYVWDNEGKKYLDYGMALRAVTIGYSDEYINAAAFKEIEKGNNLTRPSTTELKAAELLVDLIPSFDMVKFAKNGSNATTAALKISRAFTGRDYICIPRQHPFFSFDDWFIGTTKINRGIPEDNYRKTLMFDYGNIDSLLNLFRHYKGKIAAVMLEPVTNVSPCSLACKLNLSVISPCTKCENNQSNFLKQVEVLCKENNILFILDEMITGFRWHLQGAQTYFGVSPDISTFGKAMANGFSVAAVGGRKEVMEVGSISIEGQERTFLLSTTHGAEMSGLGAFIETIRIYKEKNVINYLWDYGQKLSNIINDLSRQKKISDYFYTDGPVISMNYITKNQNKESSLDYRTLFNQELIKNGVLMPWIATSLAHGEKELEFTTVAVDAALDIYKKALKDGIEKYLIGPTIKPVFRKFN